MLGKTTSFTIKDFKQQGVFNQFDSECKINGLTFRKSDVYKNQEIKQVLNICKKHNSLGSSTLMVRSVSDLTIWVEQKSQPAVQSDYAPPTFQDRQSAEATQTNSSTAHPLPTKTITKKYRGQVYEETVVDWAAVAVQNQETQTNSKVRRKYRGNYID